MSRRFKSSWGRKILKKDDVEPEPDRQTFLFDISLELALKVPKSSIYKKGDIIRTALTVVVGKVMSLNRDWSQVEVGEVLLNRLRKYIAPSENDWRFEIRANDDEYWKFSAEVHLARHCAPLRDTHSYPDFPMYEEVNFDGIIGKEFELSYALTLFLSSAIFGAHDLYNGRGFERTSPWYKNDEDEENLVLALDIFQDSRESREIKDYKKAWYEVIDQLMEQHENYDDDNYGRYRRY